MKAPEMKKTPSALKWLAEKRGRVAPELQQTAQIAETVQSKLKRLTADLAGLDRTIRVYDGQIDPESIEPVASWKGRCGPRGALREAAVRHLQANAPQWVATDNLEMLIAVDFGLAFATAGERKQWYDNSFRRCLKKLVEVGLIERLQDPVAHGSDIGMWRWKQEKARTLSDLRATQA